MNPPTILWLNHDLRLNDNPALAKAAAAGPVLPVYVLDESPEAGRPMGAASAWWLRQSLKSLARRIHRAGGTLLCLKGESAPLLAHLARDVGATGVYWNDGRTPDALKREAAVAEVLEKAGIGAFTSDANCLFPPGSVTKDDGSAYKVFSAFRRTAMTLPAPLPPPTDASPTYWIGELPALETWDPADEPAFWAKNFYPRWTPGEDGARARAGLFLSEDVMRYKAERDRPDLDTTSRLSPYLAFGEVSVARLWSEAAEKSGPGAEAFRSELLWREFAHHTLLERPEMTTEPMDPRFAHFPWREDDEALTAWQKGETGYPIVDAAMRQLWQTGWMHNRLRMVVASFLVKDLGLDWRLGEAWFWDTLVDADLASNTFNWQWVAGCGYDAAPFFRIFHPTRQAEKFDPKGDFIRHYVPELADMEGRDIHAPETAAPLALSAANIRLGEHYPLPIVDHAEARKQALTAFDEIKK